MDLEVAIEHVTYANLAAAFEKVTGHPAQYIDTNLDTYWRKVRSADELMCLPDITRTPTTKAP
jgi:hypothetical protein